MTWRSAGLAWARGFLALGAAMLALWLSGCAVVNLPKGAPVESVWMFGRGCVDIGYDPATRELALTVQADASTDPASIRALPSIAREIIVALVGAPSDVLRALVGAPPGLVPGPSEIHGCAGLFEEVPGAPVETPPSPGLVERLKRLFR